MRKVTQHILLLGLLIHSYLIFACKQPTKSTSEILVIDGELVTKAEQAPGTYIVKSYVGDSYVGTSSGVLVSLNTLLTSGHVLTANRAIGATRMDIIDYQGKVLRSFDPRITNDAKAMLNPEYLRKEADIGAYVFNRPLDPGHLSHGFVSVTTSEARVGQSVYLVGAGIQDYRALDTTKANDGASSDGSGVLRFGANTVAQADDGAGFYINGLAFSTPEVSGQSVSGPGDSGGAVFRQDLQGGKEFVGLMQGGGLFNPNAATPDERYFEYRENPAAISSQPNSAYSYVVDVTKQEPFLQQVLKQGGRIEGRALNPGTIVDRSYIYLPTLGPPQITYESAQ